MYYFFQCNQLNSSESIKELFNNQRMLNATNWTDMSQVYNLLHSQSLTAHYGHFPWAGLNTVSFCVSVCSSLPLWVSWKKCLFTRFFPQEIAQLWFCWVLN